MPHYGANCLIRYFGRAGESGGRLMTIMSPSTKRIPATEGFNANEIRTLIAAHLGVDIKRVTDEARFIGDLGADWLDHLELMIMMEDRFGLEITEDNVNQIKAVGDLIRYIEKWFNQQKAEAMTEYLVH
jgi:acyl carrier protein